MRLSALVIVCTFIAVLLAGRSNSGSCVHIPKASSKPRFVRGDRYRPRDISTGRDFGKRDYVPAAAAAGPRAHRRYNDGSRGAAAATAADEEPMVRLLTLENSPKRIPLAWLLEEMRKKPRSSSQPQPQPPASSSSAAVAEQTARGTAAAATGGGGDSISEEEEDISGPSPRERSTFYTIADE